MKKCKPWIMDSGVMDTQQYFSLQRDRSNTLIYGFWRPRRNKEHMQELRTFLTLFKLDVWPRFKEKNEPNL